MAKDLMQRYAESLQKTIEHNFNYLKEAIEDFKGLCMIVTPEKHVPQDIIVDIRELYKEIRDRLGEIKAIQQLLQGKYRQYYRRDSLRDKSIMEFGFLAKNLYSKVEYILLQKQALAHIKEEEASKEERKGFIHRWFHSKDHQVIFLRNLRMLHELDYAEPSDPEMEERRKTSQEKVRHLTLFCFKGKIEKIDEIYSRIGLREHDILERYAQDEIHGLIAHLKEVDPWEVEKIFQRITERGGISGLKCLLIPIHSPKQLENHLMDRVKKALEEMKEGEIKTLRPLESR